MAPANEDLSTPVHRDPGALYEAYQKSNDLVHRRQLLRAIVDWVGPPADGAEIWLLLREIRALVAEQCSLKEAERLVLDHARNGGFLHYRGYTTGTQHSKAGGTRPTPLIDPRNWGASALSTHYLVDWDDSCVSYARLEVSPASPEGAVLEKLQDYLPAEPFFQTRLVRLRLLDVLVMLDQHGLLPEPSKSFPTPTARSITALMSAGSSSAATFTDGSLSKVSRAKWLKEYLTEERRADLKKRHSGITGAAKEVFEHMRDDPTVEEYAHARNIERHQAISKLFPKRKKS